MNLALIAKSDLFAHEIYDTFNYILHIEEE